MTPPIPLPDRPFNKRDASTALDLLAKTAIKRETARNEFNNTLDGTDSDEETDSPFPIFKSFYNEGGSEAIKTVTNMDPERFEIFWSNISEQVMRSYNVGRGMKYSVTSKDTLFTSIVVLKHGGTMGYSGKGFQDENSYI